MARMIVLDASVLIAYLDADDARHGAADGLFAREIDELGVNTLTLAEVLVAPARRGLVDVVLDILGDLEVVELPIPRGAAVRLASLRAQTGLRMPECCVLLAAGDAEARIATFDRQLARVASDRGIDVLLG